MVNLKLHCAGVGTAVADVCPNVMEQLVRYPETTEINFFVSFHQLPVK